MNLVVVLLEAYLSAVLGVSGAAKLDNPAQFRVTLTRHGLLPPWAVAPASRFIPGAQIGTALLMICGIVPQITALVALFFFASFVGVEAMLLATRRATDCGCFGVAYRMPVTAASLCASAVLLLLAAVHLWFIEENGTSGVTIFRWVMLAPYVPLAALLGRALITRRLKHRRWLQRSGWLAPDAA